jgi:hypothetical protein
VARLADTADLLETTSAASSAARWLTTRANVKTAMGISGADRDTLIDFLIPRASALIVGACGLAADGAGSQPTFGLETLRATFRNCGRARGEVLTLPWRVPVAGISACVEDGVTLVAGTDFDLIGAKPGRLRRLNDGSPALWSSAAILVTFSAGWSLPEAVPYDMEAAAIEQIRAMVFAAKRDPAVRSQNVADVVSVSYALPGGDTFTGVILPQVASALAAAGYQNPMPL